MMDLGNAEFNHGSVERKKKVSFWSPEDMINPQNIHHEPDHHQNLMQNIPGTSDSLRTHHPYQQSFQDPLPMNFVKVEPGTNTHESPTSPSKKPKKEIDSTKAYKCPQCEYSFNRRDHLVRHSLVHTKLKPFHCVYCNKDYTRNDHLRRHQQRIHAEETIASASAASTNEVSQRFICQQCKAIFSSSGHLRVHMENKHQNEFTEYGVAQNSRENQVHNRVDTKNAPYVIVDGKKRPLCNLCGKSFAKSDHLKRHINKVHAGMTASTFQDYHVEQSFVCPFTECNKNFSRHDFLRRHLDDAHQNHSNPMMNPYNNSQGNNPIHDNNSLFPVPPMGMFGVSSTFESNPLINEAPKIVKPSPAKDHLCMICNKKFSRRYHLTRHQKTLHGGVFENSAMVQ